VYNYAQENTEKKNNSILNTQEGRNLYHTIPFGHKNNLW